MSLWFFGWVGTVFLSSTRVIFAAAFDRVLPDRAAEVPRPQQVPVDRAAADARAVARAGRAVRLLDRLPDLHARRDASVIAVTYLFSAIAVVILPLAQAGPVARLAGQRGQAARGADRPGLRGDHYRAARASTSTEWLQNAAHGVNNRSHCCLMGAMYVLAIVVYVIARVVCRRQGIDLGLINKEIPVE